MLGCDLPRMSAPQGVPRGPSCPSMRDSLRCCHAKRGAWAPSMSRSTWEEHRGPALSLTGGARSSRHGNGKLEAAQESAAGSAESYDDAAQPLKGMMADLVTTRIVGDRLGTGPQTMGFQPQENRGA